MKPKLKSAINHVYSEWASNPSNRSTLTPNLDNLRLLHRSMQTYFNNLNNADNLDSDTEPEDDDDIFQTSLDFMAQGSSRHQDSYQGRTNHNSGSSGYRTDSRAGRPESRVSDKSDRRDKSPRESAERRDRVAEKTEMEVRDQRTCETPKDNEATLKRAAIEKLVAEKAKKSKVESDSSSSSDSSDSSDSSSEDEKSSKYGKYIKKLKVIKKRLEKKERGLERCKKKLKAEKETNAELTKFANEQTDTIYRLKSEKDGSKNTDNLLKNTEDRMKKEIIKNTDYLKEKFDRSLKDLKSALTYV